MKIILFGCNDYQKLKNFLLEIVVSLTMANGFLDWRSDNQQIAICSSIFVWTSVSAFRKVFCTCSYDALKTTFQIYQLYSADGNEI